MEDNRVFLSVPFCASSRGQMSCLPPLTWPARLEQGCRCWGGRPAGCPHLCRPALHRLVRSPLGFVKAVWADWLTHLCPGYTLRAEAHPRYPPCSGCCIRRKAAWNRWGGFGLESKPVQALGNLSHFRGKNSECKVGWVSPTLPVYRRKTGNWRDSASPFPPMNLSHKQHILAPPFGFLTCSHLWGVGTT